MFDDDDDDETQINLRKINLATAYGCIEEKKARMQESHEEVVPEVQV